MTKQMYVFLEEGDIVQEGDEYLNIFRVWEKQEASTGDKLKLCDNGEWRRPISQPTAPDTVCAQLRQVGDVAMTTGGLTKREWFAGMALSGLMVDYDKSEFTVEENALLAFQTADTMIKSGKETE